MYLLFDDFNEFNRVHYLVGIILRSNDIFDKGIDYS